MPAHDLKTQCFGPFLHLPAPGTPLGVDVGYSWLMGSKRNFYIGIGIGATRLFGGDIEDGSATIPSLRLLNVGFAF